MAIDIGMGQPLEQGLNRVDFDSLNIAELRDGRAYRHRVMMDIPKMMGQLGAGAG